MDVTSYCDKVYKQMVGMKAGLYDLTCQVGKLDGGMKEKAAKTLEKIHGMVAEVDKGMEELMTACPADWAPNRTRMDTRMRELTDTLQAMADQMEVAIPDTTAWI